MGDANFTDSTFYTDPSFDSGSGSYASTTVAPNDIQGSTSYSGYIAPVGYYTSQDATLIPGDNLGVTVPGMLPISTSAPVYDPTLQIAAAGLGPSAYQNTVLNSISPTATQGAPAASTSISTGGASGPTPQDPTILGKNQVIEYSDGTTSDTGGTTSGFGGMEPVSLGAGIISALASVGTAAANILRASNTVTPGQKAITYVGPNGQPLVTNTSGGLAPAQGTLAASISNPIAALLNAAGGGLGGGTGIILLVAAAIGLLFMIEAGKHKG
jgi:hypothetical protein